MEGHHVNKLFWSVLVILAIAVISQSRLVEKGRYSRSDPLKCNILTAGKVLPPEVNGTHVSFCNCTLFGAFTFKKDCIVYEDIDDDNNGTSTVRTTTSSGSTTRRAPTSSTTARTWRPPTSSTTTPRTTTTSTRSPTSSTTRRVPTTSTRIPTTSTTTTSTTTQIPTTSTTLIPPPTTSTRDPLSSSQAPPTTTTQASTTLIPPPTTSTRDPLSSSEAPPPTTTPVVVTSTERASRKGFTKLTRDDSKEQVFIQGHWYNKDGTTNKGEIQGQSEISAQATFQQCLHHDNSSGCDTMWTQRYWTDNRYYKAGGPIFIEIAGEWDAESDINGGTWFDYAYQYNAMLIVLEHRFYGQSFPVNNPTVDDLWLMTSQLALADAAYFIETYTAQNSLAGSNWVAFGCSYGGNLAAWFKLKYPNHVKTAVSSSGPVEALYDFPGYLETVSEVIQQTDPDCSNFLYTTFTCMEAFANGTASNCGPYNTLDDMKAALGYCWWVDWNGNSISKQNMFNHLSYPPWASNTPIDKVTTACNQLRQSNGADNVQFYGNFLNANGYNTGCTSSTLGVNAVEEKNQFMKTQEAWQTGAAGWNWQTCNEFGYFMSSDPCLGTFGRNTFSGDVYGAACRQYGDKYTREYVEGQIAKTNAYYGGKNLDSKCVIFVHGSYDPWHSQGVTQQKAGNTVIVVPGTEHCADLGNPTTAEMAAAQQTIKTQIGAYLNDPNC